MVLNIPEQTDGYFERFLIAGGTVIFAQPVDGKTDGINLLFGIERFAFVVEIPIDAAKFLNCIYKGG